MHLLQAAAMTRDGSFLVVGYGSGAIALWDVANGNNRLVRQFTGALLIYVSHVSACFNSLLYSYLCYFTASIRIII